MHGTIMVFFVVSAALSGFANFVIPLQIGARDMAYPLLNMLSYWTIVPACLLMMVVVLPRRRGAAAAGWTMYPPSERVPEAMPGSGMGQTLWILLGMALFIVSFTMGGLNFLTTILNMPGTKGMSMWRHADRRSGVSWSRAILGASWRFRRSPSAAIMLLFDRQRRHERFS